MVAHFRRKSQAFDGRRRGKRGEAPAPTPDRKSGGNLAPVGAVRPEALKGADRRARKVISRLARGKRKLENPRMYLIEQFARLDGRDDTVSVYLAGVDEETLSGAMLDVSACFMRMAATLAKMAIQQDNPGALEAACRMLNRAMEDCTRDGSR